MAPIVAADGARATSTLKVTESAPKGFEPRAGTAARAKSLEGFLFPATYELQGARRSVADLVPAAARRRFKQRLAGST